VGGIDKLKPYFAITFVKKSELPGHALWKGTMAIDGNVMQQRLGKRLDQEEIYCTFQPKDIYESMEDAHVNKDEVMEMLLSIEDFKNIRMIRLRPLRQHEPPSVFRKSVVEPEIGGFIGLNREMGRRLFKEYKRRGAGKPKPLLLPPPSKKKSKALKKPVVYDSGSDVETVNSDFGDTNFEIDTYSDSSSDEDDESLAARELECSRFDPCDPERIAQTTHYFPHPALDLETYMISKDIVDNDRVMAYYAKTWGPKSSRKKNKKQDIAKQDYQRFEKAQRDYLSSNPRLPRVERENEEGYKWTLVEADDDDDGEKDGWKLSLKGDDPYSHLIPRIVELAKQDNEMIASKQLFEMKNPGFKKHSRTWVDNASFLSE
jgi:hypothetical protein